MDIPLVFEPEKWSPESIFEFYVLEQKNAKSKGDKYRTVFRISGDAVVKHVNDDSEVIVMNLVLKTKIPTPRLLLHVEHGIYSFVVLEYIEGQTLAEAWSSMPFEQKEFVIETLHDYVVQLREIKDEHSSTPGPLGAEPMVCDTFQLGYRARGPFRTYAELTGFLNRKLDLVNRKRPSDPLGPFNEAWPLVLIHNDLNMTNIIIDNNGKVWLIDWGMSGYYPQYFDQYAMEHTMQSLEQPSDWVVSIPRITGDYPKEMEMLVSIQAVII